MGEVLINPPAAQLGVVNAILTGRARHYYVPAFEGPLSVKSVLSGSAAWSTRVRFDLSPGECLLLNDGQTYDIAIESRSPVETFCVFFRRGFVEDACRAESSDPCRLLDDPWAAPKAGFFERVHGAGDSLVPALDAVRRALNTSVLEDSLFDLARAIARKRVAIIAEWNRIPAQRLSKRDELYRRVLLGRDYLASAAGQVHLEAAARAACLSTYHFHRLFTSVFRETPHRFVTCRRLARAVVLLQNTNRLITDIALECGFATPSALSNSIRKAYGATPTQIRAGRIV
jgi:AraC family transcriptional regulator